MGNTLDFEDKFYSGKIHRNLRTTPRSDKNFYSFFWGIRNMYNFISYFYYMFFHKWYFFSKHYLCRVLNLNCVICSVELTIFHDFHVIVWKLIKGFFVGNCFRDNAIFHHPFWLWLRKFFISYVVFILGSFFWWAWEFSWNWWWYLGLFWAFVGFFSFFVYLWILLESFFRFVVSVLVFSTP